MRLFTAADVARLGKQIQVAPDSLTKDEIDLLSEYDRELRDNRQLTLARYRVEAAKKRPAERPAASAAKHAPRRRIYTPPALDAATEAALTTQVEGLAASAQHDGPLWMAALQRSLLSPESLTDVDLAQLAVVNVGTAVAAAARRQKALPSLEKALDEAIAADDPFAVTILTLQYFGILERIDQHRFRIREIAAKAIGGGTKALEARVAELEARPPALTYRGVYDGAKAYEQNNCVTYGGHLWVALRNTVERPGLVQKSDDWKLAVKAGRDGKDCTTCSTKGGR